MEISSTYLFLETAPRIKYKPTLVTNSFHFLIVGTFLESSA